MWFKLFIQSCKIFPAPEKYSYVETLIPDKSWLEISVVTKYQLLVAAVQKYSPRNVYWGNHI